MIGGSGELALKRDFLSSVWGDVRVGLSSLLFVQSPLNHFLHKMLGLGIHGWVFLGRAIKRELLMVE